MLKRIEVTEPPNNAPQYMQESRMMADTGCMPKVSGSSSDTPLGAPRPGSTPTTMPSSTRISIRKMWLPDSAIEKPWSRASRFSNETPLKSKRGAEHAARQRDLECKLEYQVERHCCGDRGDGREDERASLVPGERAEHIAGRGEIHACQRNSADINHGRDKEHSEPLEFARPK